MYLIATLPTPRYLVIGLMLVAIASLGRVIRNIVVLGVCKSFRLYHMVAIVTNYLAFFNFRIEDTTVQMGNTMLLDLAQSLS